MKLAASLLVASVVAVSGLAGFGATKENPYLADAAVLIETDDGKGSGVHIGDGLVLTAAHVIMDGDKFNKTIEIVTAPFQENQFLVAKSEKVEAEVLWANKQNDIALVRTKKPLPAKSMNVSLLGDESRSGGDDLRQSASAQPLLDARPYRRCSSEGW